MRPSNELIMPLKEEEEDEKQVLGSSVEFKYTSKSTTRLATRLDSSKKEATSSLSLLKPILMEEKLQHRRHHQHQSKFQKNQDNLISLGRSLTMYKVGGQDKTNMSRSCRRCCRQLDTSSEMQKNEFKIHDIPSGRLSCSCSCRSSSNKSSSSCDPRPLGWSTRHKSCGCCRHFRCRDRAVVQVKNQIGDIKIQEKRTFGSATAPTYKASMEPNGPGMNKLSDEPSLYDCLGSNNNNDIEVANRSGSFVDNSQKLLLSIFCDNINEITKISATTQKTRRPTEVNIDTSYCYRCCFSRSTSKLPSSSLTRSRCCCFHIGQLDQKEHARSCVYVVGKTSDPHRKSVGFEKLCQHTSNEQNGRSMVDGGCNDLLFCKNKLADDNLVEDQENYFNNLGPNDLRQRPREWPGLKSAPLSARQSSTSFNVEQQHQLQIQQQQTSFRLETINFERRRKRVVGKKRIQPSRRAIAEEAERIPSGKIFHHSRSKIAFISASIRQLFICYTLFLLGDKLIFGPTGSGSSIADYNNHHQQNPFLLVNAKTISIKIGALFEETDFEQSNVFVRTIKMINEGKADAIRQLLTPPAAAQQQTSSQAASTFTPSQSRSPSPTQTTSELPAAPNTNRLADGEILPIATVVPASKPDEAAKLSSKPSSSSSLFVEPQPIGAKSSQTTGPGKLFNQDETSDKPSLVASGESSTASSIDGELDSNANANGDDNEDDDDNNETDVDAPSGAMANSRDKSGGVLEDSYVAERGGSSEQVRQKLGHNGGKQKVGSGSLPSPLPVPLSPTVAYLRKKKEPNDDQFGKAKLVAEQHEQEVSSSSHNDHQHDHKQQVKRRFVIEEDAFDPIPKKTMINEHHDEQPLDSLTPDHHPLTSFVSSSSPSPAGKWISDHSITELKSSSFDYSKPLNEDNQEVGDDDDDIGNDTMANSRLHEGTNETTKWIINLSKSTSSAGAGSGALNESGAQRPQASLGIASQSKQQLAAAADGNIGRNIRLRGNISKHRLANEQSTMTSASHDDDEVLLLDAPSDRHWPTEGKQKPANIISFTHKQKKVEKKNLSAGSKLDHCANNEEDEVNSSRKTTTTMSDNNNELADHHHNHHGTLSSTSGLSLAERVRRATATLTNGFSIWSPFGARLTSPPPTEANFLQQSSLDHPEGKTNEPDQQHEANHHRSSASSSLTTTKVRFEPMVEFLSNRDSSFEADKRVCQLIESGVRTLVGPLEGLSIQHIQSICDNMELPYFQLRPFLGSLLSASAAIGRLEYGTPTGSKPMMSSMMLDSENNNNRKATRLPIRENQTGSTTIWPHDSMDDEKQHETEHYDGDDETMKADRKGDSLTSGAIDTLRHQSTRSSSDNPNNHQPDLSIVIASSSSSSRPQQPPEVTSSASRASSNNNQFASPTYVNNEDLLTLNLHPPAHILTSAYIDLIYAWNWTSFAIVYEHDSSMIKLQDLFRESSGTWTSRWKIKLFRYRQQQQQQQQPNQHQHSSQLPGGGYAHEAAASSRQIDHIVEQFHQDHYKAPDLPEPQQAETFRDLFWRIKRSGEQNVILDLTGQNLNEALKQAQQVGCMTDRFNYLVTSLDLHIADLENFKYGRTRITALSLIDLDPHSATQLSTQDSSSPPEIQWVRNHLADEQYLDQLGLQMLPLTDTRLNGYTQALNRRLAARAYSSGIGGGNTNGQTAGNGANWKPKFPKFKLSPSIVLDKSGSYMDPPSEAFGNGNGAASSSASGRSRPINDANGASGLNGGGSSNGGSSLSSSSYTSGYSGGGPIHPTSGYQVARSQAEDELFHLLIEQQAEIHNLTRVHLATTSAILHDSLILLALGLRELDPNGSYMETTAGASDGFIGNATDEADRGGGPKGGNLPRFLQKSSHEQPIQLSCSKPDSGPWRFGSSLINYMRRLNFVGLSGNVRFDQRGLRTSFKLNVLGVANEIGLVKVGEWHSDLHNQSHQFSHRSSGYSGGGWPSQSDIFNNQYQDEDNVNEELPDVELELQRVRRRLEELHQPEEIVGEQGVGEAGESQQEMIRKRAKKVFRIPYKTSVSKNGALRVNKVIFERLYKEQTDQIDTLIVTTKLSQPYFMLKETPNKLEGNDQYEGFAVDLVHELSRLLNFRYRWREVADKKYGARETLPNGTVVWNGMIGEIVRGEADLAIVDLTITSQREEAVDFTLPFMNTGISILFKKPTMKMTTLYSFLSPFTRDVWGYVLAAYCGISAILFFVGHLSPYEWADPHPCPHLKSDDSLMGSMLHNQFSLPNSFWFTIGSLMQQGSDLTPRSMSTRTIAGIWYFFTLIMISSYTANLAAFLTVEKVVYPIENVRDLANQHEIKYGCVESGSTCTFFKDSQIETYKKINETMHKHRSFLKSNEEGEKRVEEGKFAFFMESASIEYIIERNCNLTQIGGLLDSKGYGLATSKKARLKRPYRTLLSEGILHLQETGMLHVLKNRWWKERRGGGTCTDDGKGGGVTELSLANVGGVFVVLVGGLCLAFTVAMGEFLWRSRRNGMSRNNLCDHMMNDLKFALNCTKSVKTLTPEERLAKRQRSLVRMSSSLRSQSQSESQSQLNTLTAPILNQPIQHHLGHNLSSSSRYNHNNNNNGNRSHYYASGLNHNHDATSQHLSSNHYPSMHQSATEPMNLSSILSSSQRQQHLIQRKPIVGFSTSEEVDLIGSSGCLLANGPAHVEQQNNPAAILASMLLQRQLHEQQQLQQQQQQKQANNVRQPQQEQQTQRRPQQQQQIGVQNLQQQQQRRYYLAQQHHPSSLVEQNCGGGGSTAIGNKNKEVPLAKNLRRPRSEASSTAAAIGAGPKNAGKLLQSAATIGSYQLVKDNTTSQRRQLFAQQTVDTIDDGLTWQQSS